MNEASASLPRTQGAWCAPAHERPRTTAESPRAVHIPGVFVTGTDTGVGKTVLSAAIAAALRASGLRVAAAKPVLTGLDEDVEAWPRDHELLGAVTGAAPDDVARLRFGPPVSPHLAARLAACRIDPTALVAQIHAQVDGAEVAVVEGVGGLLVPLDDAYSVRDLARDLGLPVVIAARPALGTINHTLLTVEGARAAGLDVRAVVITPWPEDPSAMETSNVATIADLAGVEVVTLPHLAGPDPALLAEAGARLPVERWTGLDG